MGNEAHKEPTMEEILASIRKIISDDELSPPQASAADTEEVFDVEDNEALEEAVFTDVSAEDDVFTPGLEDIAPEPDLSPSFEEMLGSVREAALPNNEPRPLQREQVTSAPEPAEPAPVARPHLAAVEPQAPAPTDRMSLTDDTTADAAAGAIGKLITTAAKSESHTVEGLVSELLRPMLKEWLDEHLARIVEEKVEAEVQRIVRMAR